MGKNFLTEVESLKNLKTIVENMYDYSATINYRQKYKSSLIDGVIANIFLLDSLKLNRLEKIIGLINFENYSIDEIRFQKEIDKISLDIFEADLEDLRRKGTINKNFYDEASEMALLLSHYLFL